MVKPEEQQQLDSQSSVLPSLVQSSSAPTTISRPAQGVKRKRGRPKRVLGENATGINMPSAVASAASGARTSKRTRLSRVAATQANATPARPRRTVARQPPSASPLAQELPVKRGPGRPRKNPVPLTPSRVSTAYKIGQHSATLPAATSSTAGASNDTTSPPLSSVHSPVRVSDRLLQPWNQLTPEELLQLRKKMKKSSAWNPSIHMIVRELEGLGRGPSNKHLFRHQWEGKPEVTIGPEKGGIGNYQAPQSLSESDNNNRGVLLNRYKKLKRAREKAEGKSSGKHGSQQLQQNIQITTSTPAATRATTSSDDTPQTPIPAHTPAPVIPPKFPVKRKRSRPKKYGKAGDVKAEWKTSTPTVPVATPPPPPAPAPAPAPALTPSTSTSAPVPPNKANDGVSDRLTRDRRRQFGTGRKGDLLLPLFSEQELKVVRQRNRRNFRWVPPWITLERELVTLGRSIPAEIMAKAAIAFGHARGVSVKKSPEPEDSQKIENGQKEEEGGKSGPIDIESLFSDLNNMMEPPPSLHKVPVQDTPVRYDLASHQATCAQRMLLTSVDSDFHSIDSYPNTTSFGRARPAFLFSYTNTDSTDSTDPTDSFGFPLEARQRPTPHRHRRPSLHRRNSLRAPILPHPTHGKQ